MAGIFQKFYADALDDPKLRRAAKRGRKELELLPWLLLWARVHGEDGRLEVDGDAVDASLIADSLPGVTTRRVKIAIASLEAEGILTRDDDGVLAFAAWETRNESFPSDTKEARRDRKRKSRERLAASADESAESRAPEPSRDVTAVTSRDVTNVTRGEEEKEEEEEQDSRPAVVTSRPEPRPEPQPPDPPPRANSWTARLAQAWTDHVGTVNPGRLGKALKPIVARHGEELVAKAIAHYGNTLLEEERMRFASPEDFARTARQWIDDVTPVGERQLYFPPPGERAP